MPDPEALQYIYSFEIRKPLDEWGADEKAIGRAHHERLKAATADGTVILAGRSLDGVRPAVVIFEAASDEEAQAFVDADPFVVNELFYAHLHPFRASLVRGE